MEYERFTEGAQKALAIAQEEAKKLGHNYVGTEHVLLGLAKAEEGVTAKVFRENDITPERVQDLVYRLVGQGDGVFTQAFDYTPRTKRVLQMSVALARSLGHSYVGSEHILLAILRESDGIAARLLTGQAGLPAMLSVAGREILWSMVFVFPVYALFLWVFRRVPKKTVL